MTHEHPNSIPNELRLSMERLLDVQGHAHDSYYKAEWDEEVRNRVIGVTIMQAVSTGARKERIHDTFRQAQFLLTETDGDTVAERFIWMPTPPQTHGEAIEVNEDYLRQSLGYRHLSPQYIAEEVISRASSPEDFATTIATMVERGIPTFSQLQTNLDHLIRTLGVDIRSSAIAIGQTEGGAAALTEILQVLPEVDFQAAAYLKTRILGALANGLKSADYFTDAASIVAYQNKLVGLMVTLLNDKTIPISANLTERVCEVYPIYRAPVGTVLLYNRLKDTYAQSKARTLFSRPRAAFAAGYITEVLGAVLREGNDISPGLRKLTNSVIHATAEMSSLKYNEGVNFDALLATCTPLTQYNIDLPQPHKEAQAQPVLPFEKVSQAFFSLLENLHSGEQDQDQSTRHMNEMRAQNVHMLLTPLIYLEHIRLRNSRK